MKRKKINHKILISAIPAEIFLLFAFFMGIMTLVSGDLTDSFKETDVSLENIETLSDEFEDTFRENFYLKNTFININGLSARILGINSLNDRQKLANGQITNMTSEGDIKENAESIIKLNKFLNERGIDFTYILVPSKRAFYNVKFAPGYTSNAQETYNEMYSILNEAGVKTQNMNAWFKENNWSMRDVYFDTDHHWKPNAGIAAARVTMKNLSDEGIVKYDESLLEEQNWKIETYNDWFLGNEGKAVGTTYAGIDDIDVYIPNFETNFSYAALHSGTNNWTYSDNPLDLHYIESKNLFSDDPFCIYLYGDCPLQIVKNSKAANNVKVLITGDSFRRDYEYFLTSQFSEIYSIDLRYYTDGTFIQYLEDIQPDIVIMCTDSASNETYYDFKLDEYLNDVNNTNDEEIPTNIETIDIEAEENQINFSVVSENLEPGQTYTITVDSTSYTGENDKVIQMALQDLTTNQNIVNRYFDANSNEKQKWIFTVPTEEDVYAIYLYAGTESKTAGCSVSVKNVIIQKGITEN